MINMPLDSIDRAAIESLVANEVGESRTLDYKEKLPSAGRDDRKEFLADVSAFANAAGGDLVFGIRERRDGGKPTGIPEAIVGLAGVTADALTLQLESIIRDGIEPRLNVHVRVVEGFDQGPVVVLRVPKSWAAPHMVKAGDSRFYSRANAGKYGMDVSQIRSAFALSETLPERVRRFRDERLGRLAAGESPIALPANAKIILHVLPVAALDPSTRVDPAPLRFKDGALAPMGANGWSPRFNMDGLLSPSMSDADREMATSYIQVFRNGALEAVEAMLLNAGNEHARRTGQRATNSIPSFLVEGTLIRCLRQFLDIEKDLGVGPPVFVMPSLLGVRGYRLVSEFNVYQDAFAIDRDALLLPDAIVEDLGEDPDLVLRPAFDALWQASGYEGCRHYKDGRWADSNGRRAL